jgi:hypothetical protein
MVLEEVFQSQSKSRERETTNLSSFRADWLQQKLLNKMRNQTV